MPGRLWPLMFETDANDEMGSIIDMNNLNQSRRTYFSTRLVLASR